MATRPKAANGQHCLRRVIDKKTGKPNGQWSVQPTVTYPDGSKKRPYSQHPTQKAALAYADKLVKDAKGGAPIGREKPVTVPQIVELFIEASGGKAPTTLSAYKGSQKNHIRPYLNVRVDVLTEDRVREFLKAIKASTTGNGRTDGTSSARVAFTLLRAALKWAALPKVGKIHRNPIEGMASPLGKQKRRTFIPRNDTQKLLDAAEGRPSQLVWRILLGTGVRRSEVTGLNVKDFHQVDGRWRLTIDKIASPESRGMELASRTKSGEGVERWVPVSNALLPYLLAATEGRSPFAPLIEGPRGGRLNHSTLAGWWERDRAAAGLAGSKYAAHQFRHSFATQNLGKMDVKVLSTILGHSSTSITMDVYQHVTDDQMYEAIEAAAPPSAPLVANKIANVA